jgi:LysM repeat protein
MTTMVTTWGEGPAVRRAPSAAVRPRQGRLRLTRRGRVVLVLLAIVVAFLAIRVGGAVASAPGEPVEVRVHVVAAGETLWGHAQRIAQPGEDVRDVVAHLVELNGLSSSSLQAGQRLLLPDGA